MGERIRGTGKGEQGSAREELADFVTLSDGTRIRVVPPRLPKESESSVPGILLAQLRRAMQVRGDRELRATAYAIEREIGDALSIAALSASGYGTDSAADLLGLTEEQRTDACRRLRDVVSSPGHGRISIKAPGSGDPR